MLGSGSKDSAILGGVPAMTRAIKFLRDQDTRLNEPMHQTRRLAGNLVQDADDLVPARSDEVYASHSASLKSNLALDCGSVFVRLRGRSESFMQNGRTTTRPSEGFGLLRCSVSLLFVDWVCCLHFMDRRSEGAVLQKHIFEVNISCIDMLP